ncbi:MAG: hypothetical protein AAFQ17_08185, partial [Pseudomonadota bacterium]
MRQLRSTRRKRRLDPASTALRLAAAHGTAPVLARAINTLSVALDVSGAVTLEPRELTLSEP